MNSKESQKMDWEIIAGLREWSWGQVDLKRSVMYRFDIQNNTKSKY